MDVFGDLNAPYFIRGILNRRGQIDFSFYDWTQGFAFHHVPWDVDLDSELSRDEGLELWESIPRDMRTKVTKKPPPPLHPDYYNKGAVPASISSQAGEPEMTGYPDWYAGVRAPQQDSAPIIQKPAKPKPTVFDPFEWLGLEK